MREKEREREREGEADRKIERHTHYTHPDTIKREKQNIATMLYICPGFQTESKLELTCH